jgi:hypothetical protein
MLLDAQLTLDNGSSLVVAAPGQASAGVIDYLGLGVGQAPTSFFGVQNAVFGEDVGIGDGMSPPVVVCVVGTTFATATGATLRVQLQESVDSGAAGAPPYSPNAWQTILQTADLTAAQLTAGTKIAEFAIPPRNPGQAFPRFLRFYYYLAVAGSSFTAGTLAYAGVSTGRDDAPLYPAAF